MNKRLLLADLSRLYKYQFGMRQTGQLLSFDIQALMH